MKRKALATEIDQDKVWKWEDEETRQRNGDIKKLKLIGTWRKIPAKQLAEEMERVLPKFWKEEYRSKKKKDLVMSQTSPLAKYLSTLANKSFKYEECKYLKEVNRKSKRSFERKRKVFQSCGTNIADCNRYKHSMDLSENKDKNDDNN